MHRRPLLVSLVVSASLLQAARLQAQTEHGGTPPSLRTTLVGALPTVVLPLVDAALLRAEDERASGDGVLRFGAVLPVALGLERDFAWEGLAGGGRVARLRISSPGAFALGLVLARFRLPEGVELYVHDDDYLTVRGAYTSYEELPSGEFAIQPTPGAALVLELYEPAGVGAAELEISSVVHDYRGVFALLSGSVQQASCQVDVNCPQGDPWRDQINGTLQVISGGALCSGSLVNDTARDGRQLFFSAYHCGPMTTAIFLFNYQHPQCGSGTAPTNQSVVGANELAANALTDYRLMEILPPIPAGYGARCNGWNRRKANGTQSVVGVSHPNGSVKRIHGSNQPPTRSGGQWAIGQWNYGLPLPGSSGSPLFTDAGRFIGTLSFGGHSTCAGSGIDIYQALDAYWSDVAPFLDPLGTGELDIAGFDPFPASIVSVVPSTVEALQPGTTRTVVLNGTNFPPSARVFLDGVAVDAARVALIDPTRIEVDLPQVGRLGAVPIEVRDGSDVAASTLTLVAPATPKLELGDGNVPNTVSEAAGMDVIVAGKVGRLEYLYYSPSSLPSTNAFVQLSIGNQFTSLFFGKTYGIPGSAWAASHEPIPVSAINSTFYAQTIEVGGVGRPLPVSNRQTVVIAP